MDMLKGKVAVVTGASRGIGRAIALEMAKQGARVVINYNGSEESARLVEKEIVDLGEEARCYQCDVSDYGACEQFMKQVITDFGSLDILVNNAGITRDGLLLKMSEEDFDEVIRINLKGAFHCCRFAGRQMLKQRSGRIINLSSVSGVVGNPGQVNYSASKAGILGLTKTIAKELAGRQITVNAIAPGFIDTDMTRKLSEETRAEAIRQIPLGSFGTPWDIAQTAVFLASDRARYITGQVILVDGGMAM